MLSLLMIERRFMALEKEPKALLRPRLTFVQTKLTPQ
jgi:hypothetical protein